MTKEKENAKRENEFMEEGEIPSQGQKKGRIGSRRSGERSEMSKVIGMRQGKDDRMEMKEKEVTMTKSTKEAEGAWWPSGYGSCLRFRRSRDRSPSAFPAQT